MPLRAFRQVVFLIALSQLLVAQTTSAVSLFLSPESPVSGARVTITATVTPSGATGRVTFYDGGAVIGLGRVTGGRAVVRARVPGAIARLLRAHYSGDTSYSPSDSVAATQSVSHGVNSAPKRPRAGAAPVSGPFLISTIAGLGMPPTSMPGTSAAIGFPGAVTMDSAGNLYYTSLGAVFRLDPLGAVTRAAGTGQAGYSGDNGPALNAQIDPTRIAVD